MKDENENNENIKREEGMERRKEGRKEGRKKGREKGREGGRERGREGERKCVPNNELDKRLFYFL